MFNNRRVRLPTHQISEYIKNSFVILIKGALANAPYKVSI